MAAKKQAPTKVDGKAAKVKVPPKPQAFGGTPIMPPTEGLSLESEAPIPRVTDLSHEEKLRRIAILRSKHPGAFVPIDELTTPYLLRRPTGIIELDIALGGGFPAGGASMLSGPYNSGKSWMLWRMFAMQQRIYGDEFIGAVVHAEGALDFVFMRQCGFIVPVPDEVLDVWNRRYYAEGLPQLTSAQIDYWKATKGHVEVILGRRGKEESDAPVGEDILQVVLDLSAQNAFSLIGLDSISSLQPGADADKDMDDENKRAAHAQMMKKFWLHYVPTTRTGRNKTTLMMIQQVVAKDLSKVAPFMLKFEKEWETKGAESSKHYKLVDLVLWGAAQIKDGADRESIGKVVKWRTQKGKAGTHDNLTGEYNYYYSLCGNDVAGDLILSAYQRGIILNYGGS